MAEADLGIAVHAVLLTQPLLTSSMCKARLKAPAEPGVATVVRRLILRVLERLLVLLSAESLSASPSYLMAHHLCIHFSRAETTEYD
jgi:hypothetical protein